MFLHYYKTIQCITSIDPWCHLFRQMLQLLFLKAFPIFLPLSYSVSCLYYTKDSCQTLPDLYIFLSTTFPLPCIFSLSSLLCFLFSLLSSVALPFHFLLSYIFLLISSETYGSFDTVISFLHPILVFALVNSASFSSISLPFSPWPFHFLYSINSRLFQYFIGHFDLILLFTIVNGKSNSTKQHIFS